MKYIFTFFDFILHFFHFFQKIQLGILYSLLGCMVAIVAIFNFSVKRISWKFLNLIINYLNFVGLFIPIVNTFFKRSNFFKFCEGFLNFILIKEIDSPAFINIFQFIRIDAYKKILPSRAFLAQQ